MKKILALLTAVLLATSVFAQDLSITDIAHLQKKDLDYTKDYLNRKGWVFKGIREGNATWAYGQTAMFVLDIQEQEVSYMTLDEEQYKKLLAELNLSTVFKFAEVEIDEGDFYLSYEGNGQTLALAVRHAEHVLHMVVVHGTR